MFMVNMYTYTLTHTAAILLELCFISGRVYCIYFMTPMCFVFLDYDFLMPSPVLQYGELYAVVINGMMC